MRFGDRLRVEWCVDESLLDLQVPSLIVLPLVENAIRHGLSPKVGPGRLTISAESEGASLVLTVEDDGLGATLPLRPRRGHREHPGAPRGDVRRAGGAGHRHRTATTASARGSGSPFAGGRT